MRKPDLKYRYALGLGDIIACTLHSKPIGWLVHFITGNKEPCQACSQRAIALNILFPIPVWRLSFKTIEERDEALLEDFKKSGFQMIGFEESEIQPDKNVSLEIKNQKESLELKKIDDVEEKIPSEIKLITSNDMTLDPYIIKIKVYKKI